MTDYYKIIGDNFGHFPYHLGINSLVETKETFDPEPVCDSGGLYFTTAEFILKFLDHGDRLCRVRIPNGAQVVKVDDKWKADQIEIVDIQPLDIEWAIEQGADVHAGNDYALRWSAENGHVAMVECLLAHGADVHAENDWALRWSAEKGYVAMVECLLAHGADVHTGNDYALRWSAKNGHVAVVECLLAHGADVHAGNDRALRWSAENGHVAVVECLLAHGADVHAEHDYALCWSAKNGHVAVVSLLKQYTSLWHRFKRFWGI